MSDEVENDGCVMSDEVENDGGTCDFLKRLCDVRRSGKNSAECVRGISVSRWGKRVVESFFDDAEVHPPFGSGYLLLFFENDSSPALFIIRCGMGGWEIRRGVGVGGRAVLRIADR